MLNENLFSKVDAESMQFGPGSKGPNFSGWGKGSSGSRNSQTKEDAPTSNR